MGKKIGGKIIGGKTIGFVQGCLILAIGLLLMTTTVRAQSVIDEWNSVKAPPPPQLKSVSLDPKKTLLMVLDFRKGSCTPKHRPRCATALPHVQKLLQEARAHGVMVVHTTTTRTTEKDIPDELKPLKGELVLKTSMDKLSGTDLPKTLKAKGIDTILIMGTSANGAVLNTANGAVIRGFKAIVPVDTMPADGAYQEQFVVWQLANGPTLREEATITRSDMVTFK
jgi:nicotinamidase-related amidase